MKRKIVIYEEFAYIFATVILALSVAIVTTTDLGLSMIVAPAYLLSEKLAFITFGQAEYIVQGILYIIFCFIVKKFRYVYLIAFGTSLFYGFVLDCWQTLIPVFDSEIVEPGSYALWARLLLLCVGVVITAFSIALFFRVYICPQMIDLIPQKLAEHFRIGIAKFKTGYDIGFLILSILLSLIFFGKIRGLGIGTVVAALFNGTLIGVFGKFLDRHCEFRPLFPCFKQFIQHDD